MFAATPGNDLHGKWDVAVLNYEEDTPWTALAVSDDPSDPMFDILEGMHRSALHTPPLAPWFRPSFRNWFDVFRSDPDMLFELHPWKCSNIAEPIVALDLSIMLDWISRNYDIIKLGVSEKTLFTLRGVSYASSQRADTVTPDIRALVEFVSAWDISHRYTVDTGVTAALPLLTADGIYGDSPTAAEAALEYLVQLTSEAKAIGAESAVEPAVWVRQSPVVLRKKVAEARDVLRVFDLGDEGIAFDLIDGACGKYVSDLAKVLHASGEV